MIPRFLRPEVVAYASMAIVPAPPAVICAWCPDFNPATQPPGLSHGICPTCAAQLLAAERLADEDARRVSLNAMKQG